MPEPLSLVPDRASASHIASAYPDQLAPIVTPVPNLAATLTTQAEQDAEDENLSFLRGDFPDDEQHDGNEGSRRRTTRAVNTSAGSRRYTPAQLRELGELEDRANLIANQEYNGWAPGMSDEEDANEDELQPLPVGSTPALLDEHVLRRDEHLRDRMRLRRWRDHLVARNLGGTSRHQEGRETSAAFEELHLIEDEVEGLRNERNRALAAMAQTTRRTHGGSSHARTQLQRYILDRERIGSQGEERERASLSESEAPPNTGSTSSQRRQSARETALRREMHIHQLVVAQQQARRSFLEEQLRQVQQRHGPTSSSEIRRRRLWKARSSSPPCKKQSLDKAITYLASLRLCESDKEALETAEDRGFDTNDFGSNDGQDFLLDTTQISPPPKSSWLEPGTVLSGTQHASSSTPLPQYTTLDIPSDYRSRIQNPTTGSSVTRTMSSDHSNPQNFDIDSQPRRSRDRSEDRWPVKVTVHSVDHDTMMLSGTMEAFNVPDKSSPTQTSSITTYLEGEIIDFNTFTLETKSFKADTRVDGTYWRKLPPFKDIKDDETIMKNLLSKKWVCKELMEKWILMRWKEKCFVGPSDRQSSLTINGFYYISLRRDDGHVEGLYYDPLSTPYQHLSLMPEKRMFPAYTFQ